MTTTLYLIRHGKTLWNLEKRMQGSQNSDLTQEGVEQAQKLATALETIDFDAYYTSSSKRAQDTAELVFPSTTINPHDAFTEINMGSWEGKTFAEIDAGNPLQWHNFFKDPLAFVPDSGESFGDVLNRVATALDRILIEHQGKTVAIVSHRITIKIMIEYLLSGSMVALGEAEDILPNSVSVLEIDGLKVTLVKRSDTSHYENVPFEV